MTAYGTQEAYSSAGRGSAYWGSAEACVRFAGIAPNAGRGHKVAE